MALKDFLVADDLPAAEQIDKEIASGGLIPPDHYYAKLILSEERQAGEYEVTSLSFQILAGKFAGRKVKHDLFHTGKDDESSKKARNQMIHFAVKLGAMVKTGDGASARYVYTQGVEDFADVIGAECVLAVHHVPWNKQKGDMTPKAEVKMFGIYAVGSKEGRECLNKLGLAVPDDAGGTSPGGSFNQPGSAAAPTQQQQPAASAGRPKRDLSKL